MSYIDSMYKTPNKLITKVPLEYEMKQTVLMWRPLTVGYLNFKPYLWFETVEGGQAELLDYDVWCVGTETTIEGNLVYLNSTFGDGSVRHWYYSVKRD